ncbi:MAG TPA: type VI secretion system-associated FHA domain protein [Caulobacteraceae bacterium]|jgi:predicted component of type VI protein secretion system|nr:type VI secretion system-associated FHA domain protein [Caulobacteraceae bacterium]
MTVTLRLFQQSDPVQEIDRRLLTEGEIVVGRDRGADWTIADPTRTLSRRHCLFGLKGGVVTVRDDSTNGVFLDDGERLSSKAPTPVAMGQVVVLGAFLIRVEPQPEGQAQPDGRPEPADETPAGRLLDAFCGGAQIDSSVLSAEDPTEVMRRLGAIYREMVLGLGKLVDDRTRAKAEFGLEWTAVQAVDNNPFRWARPQRVAIDLLQARQEGFLASDAAVRASFEDVRDHHQRLAAASQAAAEAVLAGLAPEAVAQALQGQSRFMKKKSDALWAEYARAHGQAFKDLAGGIGGPVFREAYTHGSPDAPRPDGPAAEAAPARRVRSPRGA